MKRVECSGGLLNRSADRCREDLKSLVFLLTKPPNSERAKLCFQLVERSKNAVLYLSGDGVFNLLDHSVKALPPGSIYACKEDMDARGVQPENTAISLVEFYEQLVEDMMVQGEKVYAF
jgi:tRNA 2-thiouridine synthesizing protein B